MRILSNSAKFSAGQPLLPAYNFTATMASTHSTYRLGDAASLKYLAIENMPGTVAYCRLSNARREPLVAILEVNCHPFSYYYFAMVWLRSTVCPSVFTGSIARSASRRHLVYSGRF